LFLGGKGYFWINAIAMLTEAIERKGLFTLTLLPHWASEDDFFDFCQLNKNLRFERTATGEILVMPPTGSEGSASNNQLNFELEYWNRQTGSQGVTFDSNGGFTLPDTSVKAADATWIFKDRWLTLLPADRKKFAHIAPDFVIELMSENDRLGESQEKMMEWMDNGVRLGWLIDPKQEKVFIYRPEGLVSIVEGFDKTVSGEEVLVGFELRLERLRV